MGMDDKQTDKEDKPVVNPIRNRRDYGGNFLERLADSILTEKEETDADLRCRMPSMWEH